MPEKRCTFCGKELTFFDREVLACGGTPQPCCKSCRELLVNLPMEERARRALATGRAVEWKTVQSFLDAQEASREAERKAEQAQQDARRTGRTCSACGGEMLLLGRQTFKLGEETFFFSDWNRLISGSLELELEVCANCRKVAFYLPDGAPLNID